MPMPARISRTACSCATLEVLRRVAPTSLDAASAADAITARSRSSGDGARPLFEPRESVRVDDRQHRIANPLGAVRIGAELRRRQRGVGHSFEIVFRDRRGRQVTKSLLGIAAIDQVRDEPGIDRLGGNLRQFADEVAKNAGEGREEPIVEVERFQQPLMSKNPLGLRCIGLQFRHRPQRREQIRFLRGSHGGLLGAA